MSSYQPGECVKINIVKELGSVYYSTLVPFLAENFDSRTWATFWPENIVKKKEKDTAVAIAIETIINIKKKTF